jgi:solute carrier family 25 glutamate transporter 18/22
LILQGPRKADGSGDAVFYASFLAGLGAGAAASFSVTPVYFFPIFKF